MNANKVKHRLEELTGSISGAIDSSGNDEAQAYEFSASYSESKVKMIEGKWKVLEHTVDGVPYAESFAQKSFAGERTINLVYNAEYEFTGSVCVKRILIHGDVETDGKTVPCEYRLSIVLSKEINGDVLSVRPLIGYQYSIIDGKTAAVRDLPEATEWIKIKISFNEGKLIMTDGTDIKKLGRMNQ